MFFNDILARDEIDILFSPKALQNFELITSNLLFDNATIKSALQNTPNLLIKGNNLLALHTLKKRKDIYGQVKLIYIDPPYNTGNDSFKYNDKFNHSAWLCFMKNRLEIAKEFLREDGVIYVNIDYNEVHYLKVLMDEIFGRENFITQIIWRIGFLSGYKTAAKKYIRNYDCILFYSKTKNYFFKKTHIYNKDFAPLLSKKEIDDIFKEFSFDKTLKDDFYEFVNHKNRGEKYPLEDTWNCSKWDKLDSVGITIESNEKTLRLVGETFDGQKPEKLLQRILEVSTNEGDLVMDFFAGSGTTLAVAHKMKRRFVGIEQMDYVKSIPKERLKKVVEGEQGGISKAVNFVGGGEFVYVELMPLNAVFKEQIQASKDESELERIYKDLQEKAFVDYRVDIKEMLKDKDFEALNLDEKKRILLSVLDSNMDYVPLSEIEDSEYGISSELVELNKAFFKGGEDE